MSTIRSKLEGAAWMSSGFLTLLVIIPALDKAGWLFGKVMKTIDTRVSAKRKKQR